MLGRLMAFSVAGHHAGLADFQDLNRRVRDKPLEDYTGWQAQTGELPVAASLMPAGGFVANAHRGFSEAFLTRMLFSCLVDADFLATEQFYERGERETPAGLGGLQARLATHLAGKRSSDTALNRLRGRVLDHAVGRAGLAPGLFTLTVPTGGGKTLTSLAFALEHARRHGLRRVIYVIPYTSIIEQTAAVFRAALGNTADVLEHHASFDWQETSDDEGPAGLAKLRQASENWDAPVVVTTAVQFFESLFAARPSRCRKLHNIAASVVVLDEAQTLPLRLLRPCMAALTELAANYRTSVVLCTATQPALRVCDGFVDTDRARNQAPGKVGFAIDDARELALDPKTLFVALQRVEVVRRPGKTTDAEIVERFAEQRQMLCIVNTRRHARALFDRLKAAPRTAEGARHLTTLMCPVHRRAVLAEIRARLDAGDPVRLVATSLIEAGVDIDFPEVWRAVTGLDSIAQAAGRCNREGGLERGRTVVFEPAEGAAPGDLRPLIESADCVFRQGLDPLSLEGVRGYFQELYWRRGAAAMDAATLEGQPWPILTALHDRAGEWAFSFEDDRACVPHDRRGAGDGHRALRHRGRGDPRAGRAHAAPGCRGPAKTAAIRRGDSPARPGCLARRGGVASRASGARRGAAALRGPRPYRDETGVDLREPEQRDAAANIMDFRQAQMV